MALAVKLGDVLVGIIRTRRDGGNQLALATEYLSAPRRPVLGQYFEDHLTEIQRGHTRLPPFFSNLLPEGPLRELVARRADVHPEREAELIAILGRDLPGAVVVERIANVDAELAGAKGIAAEPARPAALRFSLAGEQLKFSVQCRRRDRGPTLATDGAGGDWIAKLPSETYAQVPENELAMTRWADRVGIRVPEVRLVRVGDLEGLPVTLAPDRKLFLSRRFDRPPGGGRVHQEDFAQVTNVRHADRYSTLGYGSLARIVRQVAGEDDFDEVVRRIAFNIVIGNGDAHLKNWSLIYPDGVKARLSPAYDLVSTVVYIPGDKLALKLARENRFEELRLAHFEKLAAIAEVDGARVVAIVRDTVQRAMASWPTGVLDPAHDRALRTHVEHLPLLAEAG